MNIVMMTNTYTPHVGGVARSVDAFSRAYRARGHKVLVVAPEFPGIPDDETDVVRIPAIQNFNGSDFSVVLPVPGYLDDALDDFRPDIVHSHHPFLMGATAIRVASHRDCPLVFTHHTMYEQYTHYVPGDSPALKRFVIKLSTSYANLCDQVFAPSESVAETLHRRGVTTPVDVVPTGVVREQFASGDGTGFRRQLGVPEGARVIGHVGRLAAEKNLGFLARAMAAVAAQQPDVHCLVVGAGPAEPEIRGAFRAAGVGERLHLAGKRVMPELADAYHAMDVFAFASLTETQGMVLAEAMAAGLPVVALDAPGAREVVRDGENGRLLREQDEAAFAAALTELLALDGEARERYRAAIADTAAAYDLEACADQALAVYQRLDASGPEPGPERDAWHASLRLVRAEWELLKGMAQAAGAAFSRPERDRRAPR
ncbi:glycosyltransferase [Spiribacter halobius]|uniref:Glycosyl transferase family 1 n=1 Tax=Sediminicurvatus halobius TaxID=2182432 RepID=A0A2U2MVY9_9GAMM|nr:glycosyltransferase [Spiribacter halobius]PWG61023.1 glycosyl transferase family 1 [Spiribacter halobius]UEX77425.1 glycosyltransferase [Spiribacter halobius]